MKERFGGVFENYKKLLRTTLGLNLFQYAYSFLTLALPSVIIAPRVISGELEVGRVVQAGGAFAAMLSALTVFVDNFESLSGFAAGIERLHAFAKSLTAEATHPSDQTVIDQREHSRLELDKVTLQTPNRQRTLVSDVSLVVEPGRSLLIVGASGGGKSSLLRAVAGLWNAGSGVISRPELQQMLFLPQRPYMIVGSLRDQLLYPGNDRKFTDEELAQVVADVNLPNLVERCGGFDAPLDFGKVLSVGEQQRLAVARVLLTKPAYVILDEATSALDAENESLLYGHLQTLKTTLVSVTHHPGLVRYHQQVLEIVGDGTFHLREAEGYQLVE